MSLDQSCLTQSYWPAQDSQPVRDVTLGDVLREAAETVPDRLALVDFVADPTQRRHWTYAQFLADAEKVARALLADFSPGERVAIWAPNSADWVVLQEGISLAGLVLVAINPAYRAQELEYVLAQSGASCLLHAESYRDFDMAALVEQVRPGLPKLRKCVPESEWGSLLAFSDDSAKLPEVAPTDPIQVQYTSGTTGFPKGALLHHKGLVNEATFVAERAGMSDGGVYINSMPMYHIGGGAVISFGAVAKRGTFVILPGFDAAMQLEAFEAYRGTHSLVVPTMLIAMLDHPDCATRDLSSLATIMSGAAAVPASLVHRAIDTLGCQFSILFGQTEMHGVISQTRVTDAPEDQAETVGQPLPQLEVKIVDPTTGEVVPVGERGEICCRGYQNMLAYYDMPEATALAIDKDGWLHMGDLGTMDERGFLRVTGRLKDMIIRGGLNIYPREIEELLVSHPDIAEAVVVGVTDQKWGEQLCGVLRLKPGRQKPNLLDLRAFCRSHLAAHKTPYYWAFLDALPMTPTGKVQKFVLKDMVDSGQVTLESAQI